MEDFWLFELVLTIWEVSLGVCLCWKILGKRKRGTMLFLPVAAGVGVAVIYLNKIQYAVLLSNTAWVVVILWLSLSLCIWAKESFWQIMAIFLITYGLIFILDFTMIVFLSIVSRNIYLGNQILAQCSGERVIFFSLLRIVDSLLIYQVLIKRERIQKEEKENPFILFGLGCILFYCMMQIQNLQLRLIDFDYIVTYVGYWGLAILLIGSYLIWYRCRELRKIAREEKQRREGLLQMYQRVREENQESYQRLHDQKHHLGLLKQYIEQGNLLNAKRYMNKIYQETLERQRTIFTGDGDLDLILNWKISEAKAKGISVATDIMACNCKERDEDFCVILGNLIDNAIEACLQWEEQEKRQIRLGIRMQGNVFVLWVQNAYKDLLKKRQGKFLSGKRGYHEFGYGIESVRRLVETKYQGILRINYSDSEFTAKVTMVL